MKRHTALLSLAVFVVFAAIQTSASTPAPTLPSGKTPEAAPRSQSLKVAPAAASANPSHLFTVNDTKGLLLTCIAPEIATNAETDVFKSCALAPGRTLDDVMHTFVQGIHYEQSQHQKEREEWQKNLEGDPDQKSTEKQ
jgi:hypothetical protein